MAEAANHPKPITVSSLTAQIKGLLEGNFTKIYVEAEISGWKRYPSGHCYFTLKDDGAQISAVMFASSFERCKAKDGLKDGAKVVVYANVTVYPPRGNYQLVVLAAKLSGEGDLMQRYLELKAKLEAEGLFAPQRKKPLPFLPRRIGIVTSEAGAVIHDMCTVLTRRFPAVEIRLYPSLVQGAEAPATIVAGIEYFNAQWDAEAVSCCDATGGPSAASALRPRLGSRPRWRADLLIVARGGGSFEDLFCFNDEALVRAVANSKIPTISAVGHETDFTLCDFAADKRAGTPSIAAEIAVPLLSELTQRIDLASAKLAVALRGKSEFAAQHVDFLAQSLANALRTAGEEASQRVAQASHALAISLTEALGRAEHRLAGLAPRLDPALALRLQSVAARLDKADAKLTAYSPYGVLDRGYSLTTAADGSVVRDAATLKVGETITTRFRTGTVWSTVAEPR